MNTLFFIILVTVLVVTLVVLFILSFLFPKGEEDEREENEE